MLRSFFLGILACWLTIIWGTVIIRVINYFRLGKQIRIRGAVASRHMGKQGTPTFGGVMIIASVIMVIGLINIANVVKGNIVGRSILIPLTGLVLFGLLGAIDDWEGIRGVRAKEGEGITARTKFLLQILLATVVALVLHFGLELRSVAIPSIPFKIDLGLWYIPIAVFIIVATSNAVNITDGLDGLAGNVVAVAFAAYGIISFLQGQIYLGLFDFVMVGAIFGFLWYNAHPAQVFMGDTGSLALGATLAIVTLMTGQWLLFPIIGFVLVFEVITDMLQIGYFWYSNRKFGERRRIFLQCPIHHHFELLGWSEVQIVFRFMFVSILSGMIGIALALL